MGNLEEGTSMKSGMSMGMRGVREPTRADVSIPRRKLADWMHEIGFGWIEGVHVVDGEPVLDPMPRSSRTIFLPVRNDVTSGPGPKGGGAFREQVLGLFQLCEQERNLLIEKILIENGLPVRVIVAVGRLN